jgi:hypothetical protein
MVERLEKRKDLFEEDLYKLFCGINVPANFLGIVAEISESTDKLLGIRLDHFPVGTTAICAAASLGA